MAFATFLEAHMRNLVNSARAAAGLDPLTFEWNLGRTAEAHSKWMTQQDTFSHTGYDGTSSHDRIAASGFDLQGRWTTGENIAARSLNDDGSYHDEVEALHEGLMDSPGHRANILKPEYTHIGIGIEVGTLSYPNSPDRLSLLITQNFGATAGVLDKDLLGSAADDTLTGDTGDDALRGFDGDDLITGHAGNDSINAGLGDDTVLGGEGRDLIHGLAGNDSLSGQAGADRIIGGRGNDTVQGGAGHDRLFGGTEHDYIQGGDGNDTILGQGGFDRIEGGPGNDLMRGGFNADVFLFSGDFGRDRIVDFEQNNRFERIDLSGVDAIVDFADLSENHLSFTDHFALIDASEGNSIRIDGATPQGLTIDDFIF